MGKDGLAAATRPSRKGQPMPMSLRRSCGSDMKGMIPDRLLAMELWGCQDGQLGWRKEDEGEESNGRLGKGA